MFLNRCSAVVQRWTTLWKEKSRCLFNGKCGRIKNRFFHIATSAPPSVFCATGWMQNVRPIQYCNRMNTTAQGGAHHGRRATAHGTHRHGTYGTQLYPHAARACGRANLPERGGRQTRTGTQLAMRALSRHHHLQQRRRAVCTGRQRLRRDIGRHAASHASSHGVAGIRSRQARAMRQARGHVSGACGPPCSRRQAHTRT